ncbi:DUF2357 domain-containing protein [Chitinophaga rhizophila]|uniref:Restriction endonuclease-like protein n=1 Tax=Chitinophaga rhizophila TaxID=2866212 RepID=A0ABS7GCQ8_9BACT|nr:DUF2357 domain-containing protein [Chitinophaga rhizophila]MBW8684452.1 restriction endonuclease-like protein [Chitinophaga rhizophila]
MEILYIEHEHFVLDVRLQDGTDDLDFIKMYHAAEKCHGPECFVTSYQFSSPYEQFFIWRSDVTGFKQSDISRAIHPVFFNNTGYYFDLDFKGEVIRPYIFTRLKSEERQFHMRLTAVDTWNASALLNFRDEPGYYELHIYYHYRTIPYHVTFRFEVFPVKLNFKQHFPAMLRQIDIIYPHLALDYLKKTYHNFELKGIDTSNIVWWTIFSNLYSAILRNVRIIIDDPYKTFGIVKHPVKARKIKKPKGAVAYKMDLLAGDPTQYFEVSGTQLIEDNYENRFVKYMLLDILSDYDQIYRQVVKDNSIKRISKQYQVQLEFFGEALRPVLKHRIFKSVKKFDGRRLPSQVLRLRAGYAGLFKSWQALEKSYRLLDGLYKIELKDIAYLYQIWCFLAITDLLKRITGVTPDITKMPVIKDAGFRLSPPKDMQSKITFNCKDRTVVELYQELRYTADFNETNAGTVEGLVRPDIIVRIGKKDQPRNLYLTYLFDAKYRFRESEKYGNMDVPLVEDLEQMSNYKEAIYNRKMQGSGYEYTKEIAAAYVLYPGKCKEDSYRLYYEEVVLRGNKGGIPLLPDEVTGSIFLEQHLRMLLSSDSKTLLNNQSIQKGLDAKNVDAYVFVAPVSAADGIMGELLVDQVALLFPWRKWESLISLSVVRYFAPYIEGKGISCFYEIAGTDKQAWRDIYPPTHPLFRDDGHQYMVIKLKYKELLDGDVHIKGMANNKRYTQIKHLYRPVNGYIHTISEAVVKAASRDKM